MGMNGSPQHKPTILLEIRVASSPVASLVLETTEGPESWTDAEFRAFLARTEHDAARDKSASLAEEIARLYMSGAKCPDELGRVQSMKIIDWRLRRAE